MLVVERTTEPSPRTAVTPTGLCYDDWHSPQVCSSRGLIVVHGLGGSRKHFADSAPRIATQVRVIALDLPGFGDSPRRAGITSVDQHVEAIDDVMRHARLGEAVLVGHSMGGLLALRFAERFSDRVAAIVLVCGTVLTFQATLARRWSPWRSAPATAFAALAEVVMAATPVPQALQRALATSALGRRVTLWPFVHRPDALSSADAATIIAGAGASGVLPTARGLGRHTVWEDRTATGLPPLHAISGSWDRIAPLSDLERFPLPLKSTTTLAAGHMAMLEAPDAFVSAIRGIVTATWPNDAV